MSLRSRRILAAILLVFATLLAYYPAIRYGGYVWDDDAHLTNNPTLFSDTGLADIWTKPTGRVQYYPLTFMSFWLQTRMFGLDPLSYHLVNVLLHAGNALLVWMILRRLGFRGGFWIAVVFALHPVNTESVAWVTERKNVLMTCFYLLAAWSYLRFENVLEPSRPIKARSRRDWKLFALAIVLFICAMLSKTVACTFPAGMAVILWWKKRLGRREMLRLIPFLIIGLGLAARTAYLETHEVGSIGSAWNYTLLDRSIIAGRATWFYVGKLLWPTNLAFSYPLWKIDASDFPQVLMPVAVLVMLAALWLYKFRIGRGPLAAVVFFLVTISPALGFIDYYTMIYSLVADHYVYIAMIGLVAVAIEPLARWAGTSAFRQRSLAIAASAIAVALGTVTYQRTFVYQGPRELWADTLEKNPNSLLARTSMGIAFRHDGKFDKALEQFRIALAIDPHNYQSLNGVGTILVDTGHLDEAVPYFRRIIQEHPQVSGGYANLGSIYLRRGDRNEAEKLYRQACRLDPYDQKAHYNFGLLLQATGRFAEAVDNFKIAVELDPRDANARFWYARCLAVIGRMNEALTQAEEAVRLKPDWPEAQQDLTRIRSFLQQRR
jgi:Tfp pilus assembly protein PilF